jgi:hypothetical protein
MATSALLPKKALMADSAVRRRYPVALFSAGIDNSCAVVSITGDDAKQPRNQQWN